MSTQLELFEAPPPIPFKYRLFVGIFPTPEAVDAITNHQVESRTRFELRGKFRPREILHLTLHHIDDYHEMPEREIAGAIEACTSAMTDQPSIEITLDHLMTFKNNRRDQPLVLAQLSGNEPLTTLHRRLVTELTTRKLGRRGGSNFVPHVTLLYDRQTVPNEPIPPVRWMVGDVVLILSHLGQTKYDRLRSWPLNT